MLNYTHPSGQVYDEDYFLRGQQVGKSNYSNYRWLPDLTLPMADHAKWLLGMRPNDLVLDYGCGPGYFVKALRMRGIDAVGFDISDWAIKNCDPAVKDYVSNDLHLPDMGYDLIWSKDCFEHIPADQLEALLPQLLAATRRMMFIIVPLALTTGGVYGCQVDELDSTHQIRWTLPCWLEFFQRFSKDFIVSGSYEHPHLKPNCYHYPRSYGFFKIRRIAS